jgi:hypothetical protein
MSRLYVGATVNRVYFQGNLSKDEIAKGLQRIAREKLGLDMTLKFLSGFDKPTLFGAMRSAQHGAWNPIFTRWQELQKAKLQPALPLVMCTHIWRFSLQWGNEHMYGKNNQRRTIKMGSSNNQ